MFHKSSDAKSDSDRLCPPSEASVSNNYNERIITPSTSKQQLQYDRNNYSSGSNNTIEEIKSQNRFKNRSFHSLFQSPQSNSSQDQMQSNGKGNNISNHNHNLTAQRGGQTNMTRSTTNPQLYVAQTHSNQQAPPSSSSKLAFNGVESPMLAALKKACKHTAASTTAMGNSRDDYKSGQIILRNHHHQDNQQQERETDEVVTMIKEELENDTDGFNETELDTLGSFEQNLPVELSFLIRQQAYCMARMNYLDRQIRELKETRQAAPLTSTPNSHCHHQNTNNNRTQTNNNIANTTASKNGNFIPSDDSGGEYSRATMSDDDELSSLLDQIAKSVRPEQRNVVNQHQNNVSINQLQQRPNYSVISNQPPHQQQYAIINPNQLHHQAVPVFVMSSPIAVAAAHTTSISSNVLPGVHFQPEPRYNQYYEDSYVQNNSSASTIHRHNGVRSQSQFDTSISAIEQLISQKEKRQIRSQLKSADNWLKMRSSGLCNLNEAFNSTNNINNNGNNGTNINTAAVRDIGSSLSNERNLPTSSSSAANESSKSVIEGGSRIS